MDNKYSHLLDKLVDNVFEIAAEDQHFLDEILKDYEHNLGNNIKKGAKEIDALVGKLKLEFGKQKHYDVGKVISGLKKLSESKFLELYKKFSYNDDPQLALQFYRKIHEQDAEDTIKEDQLIIKLMQYLENHKSIKGILGEK